MRKLLLISVFVVPLILLIVIVSCKKTPYCDDHERLYCHISFYDKDSNDVVLDYKNIYNDLEIRLYKDSSLTIECPFEVDYFSIVYYLPKDYTVIRNGRTIYCGESYLWANDAVYTIHTEYSGSSSCNSRYEKLECNGVDMTAMKEIIIVLD
ncbi:MAG: hypothetical protein IKW86_03335 [Salinivirgaceae bacterium]|nr:hypothetical protein [Salinivirgaceae bacterium]